MPVYFNASTPSGGVNSISKAKTRPTISPTVTSSPDQFQRTPRTPRFGHNMEITIPVASPDPLLTAVKQQDVEKARQALVHGHTDTNRTDEDGNPLISIAARNRDMPMATFLLANGAQASVNQPGTKYGDTALYWACTMNSLPMAQLLLANGAAQSVNTPDTANGRYPLFYAVSHNNVALTRLLLANGAAESVNSDNMNLQAVLYMAVQHNNPSLTALLLDHGAAATIDRFNPDGNTALQASVQKQNPEIAFMLLAYGARPQLVPNYFKPSLQQYLLDRFSTLAEALPEAPDTMPRLQTILLLNACRQVLQVHQAVWPQNTARVFPQTLLNRMAETASGAHYLEATMDADRAGANISISGRALASHILGTLIPAGSSREDGSQ